MDNIYSLPVCLVVSKNAQQCAWLKKTLKSSLHILTAKDKETAFEILENTFVEVLIIDGNFTLELCQEIRHLKGYSFTPLLLITNNLKKTFLSRALNAGVSDFIQEPLNEMEIRQRLAVAMKAQKVQKKMSRVAARLKTDKTPSADKELKERFLLNDIALKEISKAKTSLSMLMIEVDAFAAHLQKLGDLALEEILIKLHALLQKQLRPLDTLFSQGGGRFIILLPKTSERAAHLIAENIRSEVSRVTFKTKKGTLSLTVSIGLVFFDRSLVKRIDPYEHLDLMLETVHRALHRAKKKGNQIISSGDLP